jgi:hypothetical protein
VNKKMVLMAVAGLVLVAGATMAAGPPLTYTSLGNLAEGEIYTNNDPRPFSESAIALPTTSGGTGAKSGEGAASSKPGPTSIGSSGDIAGRNGSAIVTPRGSGPMYSPKQRADREISRLIRKLG